MRHLVDVVRGANQVCYNLRIVLAGDNSAINHLGCDFVDALFFLCNLVVRAGKIPTKKLNCQG